MEVATNYMNIANYLDSAANFEKRMEPGRKASEVAQGIDSPKCEGCGKPWPGGGICNNCLHLAAGACRWKAVKGA